MNSPFDAIREGNRAILARLAAREQELTAREMALNAELKEIESERWNLSADRETIERAEQIQARLLGPNQVGSGANFAAVAAAIMDGGQVRARIGPKRYAMLTALRADGPLSPEAVANRTGLPLQRVRDQLKADNPHHVALRKARIADGVVHQMWAITPGGLSLLERFESYRRSVGKPLPAAGVADDAGDGSDDDEVGGEPENAEAEAQTNEAAGTNPEERMPTASITGAEGASDQPPTGGPWAAERQVVDDNMS